MNDTTMTETPYDKWKKMNGRWYGVGSSTYPLDPIQAPDAFVQFDVVAVNDNAVVVYNDTLYYQPSASGNDYALFATPGPGYMKLTYYFDDGSLKLSEATPSSRGYFSLVAYTRGVHPNVMMKGYLSDMQGTRTLSGTLFDTFQAIGGMTDTTAELKLALTIKKVSSSSLSFNSSTYLDFDTVLHYKYTDAAAKTVVFQNLHSYGFDVTTLTYNYETRAIQLERQMRSYYSHYVYFKLR